MMVRRKFFEELRGFDGRLPLGYEDVEICWRAWVRGHKTVYVPSAICWHRIGASIQSSEAARFGFRGVLKGRLLLATKLLPARYAFRTWLVSSAGLGKDLSRLRWKFAADRIGVLVHMAGLLPQLLREKRALFRKAGRSPEEELDLLRRLTDDDIRADQCN
jgi:GT2 family glycosyltransferase